MIALRPRDHHVWDPRPVPQDQKSGLETTLVSRP